MASETLQRLRAATRVDHQRLEDRLDIFTRIDAPAGRRRLVERFHGLHAGVEGALAPWLADLEGLEFEARRRTRVLEADLAALGSSPAGLAVCAPAPLSSAAEALGLMYVMEGSTLGGHIICKRLEAAGRDRVGLSFLDPYGPQGGARWRRFLEILERETGDDRAAGAAARGGQAGFALTEGWLCQEDA